MLITQALELVIVRAEFEIIILQAAGSMLHLESWYQ